jgi:hypothetical protein
MYIGSFFNHLIQSKLTIVIDNLHYVLVNSCAKQHDLEINFI